MSLQNIIDEYGEDSISYLKDNLFIKISGLSIEEKLWIFNQMQDENIEGFRLISSKDGSLEKSQHQTTYWYAKHLDQEFIDTIESGNPDYEGNFISPNRAIYMVFV